MTKPHTFDSNMIRVEFTDRNHPSALNSKEIRGCKTLQIHGIGVIQRTHSNGEMIPEADGQWTKEAGLRLIVKTADCVPLLFFFERSDNEGVGRVAAAIHGGWRSGLGGILSPFFSQVRDEIQDCDRMTCWIGPHIRECCFQVGPEVIEVGERELDRFAVPGQMNQRPVWYWPDSTPGKYRASLQIHYGFQIRDLIHRHHPSLRWELRSDWADCTMCNPDRYFSYRRDGRVLGNLYGTIEMKSV